METEVTAPCLKSHTSHHTSPLHLRYILTLFQHFADVFQLIFVSYFPSTILFAVLFAMSTACPAHLLVLEFQYSIPFLSDPGGCALCNQLMAGIVDSNLADGVDVRLWCR